MVSREGDVSFTEDIIKEVSLELNMEEKKIRHVYDAMMDFIHFTATKTDHLSIKIPTLGILHLKIKKIRKTLSSITVTQEDTEIYRAKEVKLREYFKKIKKLPSLKKSRHLQKEKLKMWFYKRDMTWEDIEKFQNKL